MDGVLGTQALDQFVQTALGASRGILMNQLLAGRLVDVLLSHPVFALRFVGLTRLDRFSDLADLSSHRAHRGPIVQSTLGVLAESLLCAVGIWHRWGDRASARRVFKRVKNRDFRAA